MRILEISPSQVREHATLADCSAPGTFSCASGDHFLWLALTREELSASLPEIQDALRSLAGAPLADLHVSDLLNEQLSSRLDYTSDYDLLVFRRLASTASTMPPPPNASPAPRGGPPALRRIDTRPVGFALFERVLLSVHPQDGAVRDTVAAKLGAASAPAAAPALDGRATSARLPACAADLMLRMTSEIVDGYLALRRELTRQLDHWQEKLIDPHSRFHNWNALIQSRQALHHLDEICEDQHSAMQDWIDAIETRATPTANTPAAHEHELVLVRGRDVLEHIERVTRHVRRLELNVETAVQTHFNIQSQRTNDIMRILTVLTAIFLPLNLIAGIFGMNFEHIPLLHKADGFWIAMGSMALIALAMIVVFWRKRYLARVGR